MPTFELVPMDEAILKTATGTRAELLKEYLGYVEQLEEGKAGQLSASKGESVAAVRRRLGKAARLAGKDIVVKRSGEELLFWIRPEKKDSRRSKVGRRGRPKKS